MAATLGKPAASTHCLLGGAQPIPEDSLGVEEGVGGGGKEGEGRSGSSWVWALLNELKT